MDLKLKEITSDSRQIAAYISRLSLSPGPATIHQELQANIKDGLHSLNKDIEFARTFIEDEEDAQKRDKQRLELLRLADDLENHRVLYRRALLKAKRNLETNHVQQRAILLDNRPGSGTRRDENASNAVLQASSDVTSELRRTHELMSQELSKSALSQELLQQSSKTLENLHEEYSAFGTILSGSKRLLKELENADRTDRIWIWASLSFFLTVVAWIVYRRVLSRGIHLLAWLFGPLFSQSLPTKSITTDQDTIHPAEVFVKQDSITITREEASQIQAAQINEIEPDIPVMKLDNELDNADTIHDEL